MRKYQTMASLSVGDSAPEFSLKDESGNAVKLSSFKGKKNVVVFFYPAYDTPGCTIQAKSFSDAKSEFDKLNTVVFGVSSQGEKSKQVHIQVYFT